MKTTPSKIPPSRELPKNLNLLRINKKAKILNATFDANPTNI